MPAKDVTGGASDGSAVRAVTDQHPLYRIARHQALKLGRRNGLPKEEPRERRVAAVDRQHLAAERARGRLPFRELKHCHWKQLMGVTIARLLAGGLVGPLRRRVRTAVPGQCETPGCGDRQAGAVEPPLQMRIGVAKLEHLPDDDEGTLGLPVAAEGVHHRRLALLGSRRRAAEDGRRGGVEGHAVAFRPVDRHRPLDRLRRRPAQARTLS